MNNISATSQSIHLTQGRASLQRAPLAAPSAEQVQQAEKTKEAFKDFIGKTFYGQLLKSMRQTVGKPAYFHGGRAEEVFRSQLDQAIADKMTESHASGLAEGAFRQQFPDLANVLERNEKDYQSTSGLDQLDALRRR